MESMIKKLQIGKNEESPSPQKKSWRKKKWKKAIYNTKVNKSNYEYFIRKAKETKHVPTKTIERGGRFYEPPIRRPRWGDISAERKEEIRQ